MRKILTTSALVLLAFGATAAQAHDPAAQRAEWLGERLELSEEQQAEVNGIYAEAEEQRKALHEQAREQRKAALAQRRALREESRAISNATRERLGAVLTDEQQARLTEMRKRMDRRAIMRRGAQGRNWSRGMDRRREMARRMLQNRQKQEQAKAPAADE